MVKIGKKTSAIGTGIKTETDANGIVRYSCTQHGYLGPRKVARRHYMTVHLNYAYM